MRSRYQLVPCELGGWNVVDCLEVEKPENGRIVGATHPNRARAREALAALREAERRGVGAPGEAGREWHAGEAPSGERRATDAELCRRSLNDAQLSPTPGIGTQRFSDGSTIRPRADRTGWIAEPRFEFVE